MDPVDEGTSDADRTLRRVVVGYRAVSAAWLVILGVISIARSDGTARPGVVVATMVLAVGWATATIAFHVWSPHLIRSWALLAVDTAVAAWTLLAPDVAGSGNFYGGYPMSPVFLAAYGRGMVGGVAGGVGRGRREVLRGGGPRRSHRFLGSGPRLPVRRGGSRMGGRRAQGSRPDEKEGGSSPGKGTSRAGASRRESRDGSSPARLGATDPGVDSTEQRQ